uniref:MARVEL domain-containing protein n=1 Tax=Trichuris muris TaxID=70415 RepID=A0A5S6Q9L7_TRIMR
MRDTSSSRRESRHALARQCHKPEKLPKYSVSSRASDPLLLEYERMEQRRTKPRPSVFRRPTHLYKPARPWDCRMCGLLLGIFHVVFGSILIVFDLATNWITETVFAVTAGICFVITGITSLIASKRLDKGTITILVIFSFASLVLASAIVFESISSINYLCHRGLCNAQESTFRACLLLICLLEAVVSIVSAFVGIRSLMNATQSDLIRVSSPLHVLLSGEEAPALARLISRDQLQHLLLTYHK